MNDVPGDSYRLDAKLAGHIACPGCGASYEKGRWTWAKPRPDATSRKCPACQRIADGYPGGYVTLSGPFVGQHRDEIVGLLRAREARERGEHPMQRIIAVEPKREGLVVTTTDSHLAGALANALREAFKGEVDIHYGQDEALVRATWRR
jgi:NMD protein affecting ribosome stability and mRNA decay